MSARPYISRISALHFLRLLLRGGLFLAATACYFILRSRGGSILDSYKTVFSLAWLLYAAEMLMRFFPSSLESMGCQKQFAHNYRPAQPGARIIARERRHGVLWCALAWIALNGAIFGIYALGWIDKGILLLISLFYGVCDMICILFFCPFQAWLLHNKCCTTCRIYNWDYAMMFTPLLAVGGWWSWSLIAMALALLLRWEITAHRHPERFSEACNGALACRHCQEKLCAHKKHLQSFLQYLRRL